MALLDPISARKTFNLQEKECRAKKPKKKLVAATAADMNSDFDEFWTIVIGVRISIFFLRFIFVEKLIINYELADILMNMRCK